MHESWLLMWQHLLQLISILLHGAYICIYISIYIYLFALFRTIRTAVAERDPAAEAMQINEVLFVHIYDWNSRTLLMGSLTQADSTPYLSGIWHRHTEDDSYQTIRCDSKKRKIRWTRRPVSVRFVFCFCFLSEAYRCDYYFGFIYGRYCVFWPHQCHGQSIDKVILHEL